MILQQIMARTPIVTSSSGFTDLGELYRGGALIKNLIATPTRDVPVGDFLVALHNSSGIVTDTSGHTWTNTAANGSNRISYIKVTNPLTTASTITFNNNTSNHHNVIIWQFSITSGMNVYKQASASDLASGSPSLTLTSLPSREYLFIRSDSIAASSATTQTPDAGFTPMPVQQYNPSYGCVVGEFKVATATGVISNPSENIVSSTYANLVALYLAP